MFFKFKPPFFDILKKNDLKNEKYYYICLKLPGGFFKVYFSLKKSFKKSIMAPIYKNFDFGKNSKKLSFFTIFAKIKIFYKKV